MKSRIANRMLGRTAIAIAAAAACLAMSVRAQAAGKPSHGGGSGGGLPYATASTLNQLIADINYANSVGGAITIILSPGATFELTSANNTTDGGSYRHFAHLLMWINLSDFFARSLTATTITFVPNKTAK